MVMASTEKSKMFRVAFSGANERPFLPSSPAAGRPGGAGRPRGAGRPPV